MLAMTMMVAEASITAARHARIAIPRHCTARRVWLATTATIPMMTTATTGIKTTTIKKNNCPSMDGQL
jgi:hypothetical protein